ncbi:uncharacterized protein LOC130891096 [Diorhabda carinulata]|uniref:uncharacterized protein LOC130891096 n=1 Tax=Diorhabda carinulata TaxID=1163345 RepID=UPI0025A30674|nr:uncharacterized protein LOC130891096 [Diorhabda carinulata]
MKKYHQLILIVISITSLLLFLIYRHEYNRLHYVLEVFNFFGRPCNFSDLQTTEFTLKQHDWGPQPTWQELDNGYVYSAFLTGNIEVKAIGLPLDTKKMPRQCYFWFEDLKKPVTGKFSFSKMLNNEAAHFSPFFYYCSGPKLDQVPFAVSFSSRSKKESDVKKILLTDTRVNIHHTNINTTICASPSSFNKKRFIEFFSFHRLLGVESFIFYNKDIPYRLIKLITNLSKRLDVQVAFLPWNYPKGDTGFIHSIIEYDCLFRTYGKSRFVAALEYNEYIVPSRSFTINELLKDLNHDIHRLSLPIQKFCINNVSMNKPLALQNFDVISDFDYNSVRYVYKNIEREFLNTNAVDISKASIHKYVRCGNEVKTTTDYSMQKFSTDFIRSTLIQLLLHNQL